MSTLIVITGPTASGKTALAVDLALRLGCEVISADSRQVYSGIPVGTATPAPDELRGVRYHNISRLPLDAYYSAATFEQDTLALLRGIYGRGDRYAILCGGSMMYVDAVCRGIDDIPTVSDDIRRQTLGEYRERGLRAMCDELRRLDPRHYAEVDLSNPRRVIHAVEICRQAGVPYSSLRTGRVRQRDFGIIKMSIDYPRAELFDRINRRVVEMVGRGLIGEARRVYPQRHLNSLNTVGYKELFAHFDGLMDLDTALARIAKNTRVYAKKQLTMMRRDPDIHRLTPQNALGEALRIIRNETGQCPAHDI